MKNQRTILIVLGLACTTAAGAATVPTNQVHEKALEVLRRTIDALENRQPAPAKTPAPKEPKFAEVEQLYLQGKITAREFQKYLEDHKLDPAKLPKRDAQSGSVEVSAKNPTKSAPAPGNAAASAAAPPAGATNPDTGPGVNPSSLSDLEKKMDELLRLKAAREGSLTNSAASTTTNAIAQPAAPKTKRDRMDELLRLYINGKIPEAEYKEKRAKLLAEPD